LFRRFPVWIRARRPSSPLVGSRCPAGAEVCRDREEAPTVQPSTKEEVRRREFFMLWKDDVDREAPSMVLIGTIMADSPAGVGKLGRRLGG
jgi:hypothetical protein